MVRADPLAAARFAETNNLGDTHDLVLHRVAQLWAAQDASSALKWAAMLTSANERDAILTDVWLQVAASDPADAVRTRSQYVTDDKPNAGLEALAQRWAEKDFSAALDWALSRDAGSLPTTTPAPRTSNHKRLRLMPLLSLCKKIPAGGAQTEAVMSVLHQWGLRDLAALVVPC